MSKATMDNPQTGQRLAMLVEATHGKGGDAVRRFAADVDLAASSVYGYISGSREPGSEVLRKISAATRVSLNWLVLGSGPMMLPTVNGVHMDKVVTTITGTRIENGTERMCPLPLLATCYLEAMLENAIEKWEAMGLDTKRERITLAEVKEATKKHGEVFLW